MDRKKGIWDQHPWIVSYVSLLPQEFGPWRPQLKDAANQTLTLIQRGRGSREVELTVIQQQRRKKRAQTVWGWIFQLQWHFLSRPPELNCGLYINHFHKVALNMLWIVLLFCCKQTRHFYAQENVSEPYSELCTCADIYLDFGCRKVQCVSVVHVSDLEQYNN